MKRRAALKKDEDYVLTEDKDKKGNKIVQNAFAQDNVKKGLLPEILTELLDARSRAKKAMKAAKDPFEQALLNGRQLALKISANRYETHPITSHIV